MIDSQLTDLTERVERATAFVEPLLSEIRRVIVGQEDLVERLLVGLVTGGHILLEGVPGLAKTLVASTLANTMDASFHRIQFTPDLLPADLVGTLIYEQQTGGFSIHKGPIFANVILADEVNRAPAKVQSALLEAMQERQVTIGDTTFALPDPFLVIATQNPIEQEGTYPLPEAQVDRFMLKLAVGYPSRDEEVEIMRRMAVRDEPPLARPVVSLAQIGEARALLAGLYIDARVENYIIDLVMATRYPDRYGLRSHEALIAFGASPRASISLNRAARARALLQRRAYVTPDDVRAIALDVLRHRVAITYEAEAEDVTSEHIIREVLSTISVP